jgi:hypothetical protein
MACCGSPAPARVSGSAAEGAARKGTMVIIGGGLNADLALVYRRILIWRAGGAMA